MTMHNDDDDRIQAAFDDVKTDDSRVRSTYAAVLARAEPQSARVLMSSVLRLAAAIVVIVAAGATYRAVFVDAPRLTVPAEVVALTAWRPESDVLLTAPVKLLQAQAQVRESMIDLDTLTKGVLQ